jgi:hypothetical protein
VHPTPDAVTPADPLLETYNWIEAQGLENLRFHLAATDDLKKESITTFNVLLALAGALVAYAVKSLTKDGWNSLNTPALVSGIYLAALCALVVWKCLLIGTVPAPTNSPKNLLTYIDYPLAVAKSLELLNVDERIDQAMKRNNGLAGWINGIRLAALGAFLLAAITHFLGA